VEKTQFDNICEKLKFTFEEKEVTWLVLQNFSGKQMAVELKITQIAVRKRLSSVYLKLGFIKSSRGKRYLLKGFFENKITEETSSHVSLQVLKNLIETDPKKALKQLPYFMENQKLNSEMLTQYLNRFVEILEN
jgi:hypothetical protein